MKEKEILDFKKYTEKAAEAVSEGIVMLRNANNALPFDTNTRIAVFGRMQLHYIKSGSGSGGMVNVTKVTGIVDGLLDEGASVDTELLDVYKEWDSKNPLEVEKGWGNITASQKEMPLENAFVKSVSERTDAAVVIIARTAGEEADMRAEDGGYYLSDGERDMLRTVRENFDRMIVLLNTGGIIDMKDIEETAPDSILYIWQGGMTGGTGTARVLTGLSPSGKLPDTIAKNLSDYPAHENFGDTEKNIYAEDIYVGYRYFETFAPEKILYPFGFGLSYTTFRIEPIQAVLEKAYVIFDIKVENTGNYSGKEVVQLYFSSPQRKKLHRPARELCGYTKSSLLKPGESEYLSITVKYGWLDAYDDSGVTGEPFRCIIEDGSYEFFIGTDSHSAKKVIEFRIGEITEKRDSCLAPVTGFKRYKNNDGKLEYENVPLMTYDEKKRREENMPPEIPQTGDKGIKLADVYKEKASMDDFIGQLSDKDLAAIIRGEGMGSPKVTLGTASAFGGITESLKGFGIPCVCCDDGPSGLRLDCGDKACSLPVGTMLAATFNDRLVTTLYWFTGMEMAYHDVDVLLGPGMNIHRYPLNGRNFEYFSEDPLLTGNMGTAVLRGLKYGGVSGTLKHYCGNNQEFHRHDIDTIVSERALREIYLKGFEIAVYSGYADSIMTTYGSVNGLWTAGSYDLCNTILRKEWDFEGIVMTDWGAKINRRGCSPTRDDLAAMAIARNDLYMVCPDGEAEDGNIADALAEGYITRAELQRNAKDICEFIMTTHVFKKMLGEADEIEVINFPEGEDIIAPEAARYTVGEHDKISGENIPTDKGTNYPFLLDLKTPGRYKIKITASSDASETAQIPVTLFSLGSPCGVFTWSGTNGEPVSFETETWMFSRYAAMRLYFAQSGLKVHSIEFDILQKC